VHLQFRCRKADARSVAGRTAAAVSAYSLHNASTEDSKVKLTGRIAAILLIALAIGCVSGDQKRGTRHYNVVAVEDEWQLGAALSADIARQVQLVNDPQALTYLRSVGDRLVRQTTLSNVPWEFHIISSSEVDAFAIPGGHVYVTTGAIKAMRTAADLAGLVAHELGHAVDRQTTAALSAQYDVRELAHAANGNSPAVYQRVLAQSLPTAQPIRFTAEHEKVADDFAVKWLQGAGYDPNGAATMLQTLQAQQTTNAASVQRFFAAHPVSAEMIADIKAQVSKLPKKTGLITDEPEFHAAQGRL
jgi:beta-barrel assembly-enhancing protease